MFKFSLLSWRAPLFQELQRNPCKHTALSPSLHFGLSSSTTGLSMTVCLATRGPLADELCGEGSFKRSFLLPLRSTCGCVCTAAAVGCKFVGFETKAFSNLSPTLTLLQPLLHGPCTPHLQPPSPTAHLPNLGNEELAQSFLHKVFLILGCPDPNRGHSMSIKTGKGTLHNCLSGTSQSQVQGYPDV